MIVNSKQASQRNWVFHKTYSNILVQAELGFVRVVVLLSKYDKARGARDLTGSVVSNYNMVKDQRI